MHQVSAVDDAHGMWLIELTGAEDQQAQSLILTICTVMLSIDTPRKTRARAGGEL